MSSRTLRLLAGDRVLQLFAVAFGLALVLLVVARVAAEASVGGLNQAVDHALVWMTFVALLWGRGRLDRDERRFWDTLAAAWACWLLVEGLFHLDLSLPWLSASLTTDALYILFYLVFALAVDLKPEFKVERSLQLVIRRLESVAGLVAAFGILIYFAIVVLPEPLGVSLSFVSRERGVTPLLLLRLSLDVVLLGRLVYAAVRAGYRWRRIYGLLACAMLFFAIKDAHAVLVSEGLLSVTRFGVLHELLLSLPAVVVVLAARYRHLPPPEVAQDDDAGDVHNGPDVLRTSPLVLYAVVVPALHFLLYPLGLLEPASREPREVFSLGFVFTLGLMGWIHQALIVKDSRQARQALRKAEERLFRSQRVESVGRLAGGIAHDFNNYLTVIRGYCELVGERLYDPQAREEIGFVENAADRATNLTRQLLAFGRRQVLRPVALDLNAVVLDTRKLLESLLGEDVILHLDLDPGVDPARADLGQTEQVLMNLVLNGRDAMPRGGTLSVRTRQVRLSAREAVDLDIEAGAYVSLEIVDTGCGMSDDVLAQAFEPFFTTKGQGRGTGLGLSTVHGIVAQSGGAISLESAPDKGTTVRVLFPDAGEAVPSGAQSDRRPPPAASEATLLVVEDNDQVRSLAVRALANAGFRVHEASSGRAAVERFAQYEPVDLLITDVMMAEMDGVQLADILVSKRPGLRVLFISGYPLETLREREAVLPSSIELLEKPFTAATLVAKAQEVLARIPTGKRGVTSGELSPNR